MLKLVNAVSLVLILCFVALDLFDLVQYALQPQSYTFGTEVAGFRYSSRAHFMGSALTTLVVGAVAISLPRLLSSAKAVAAARAAAAFAMLAWSALPTLG